MIKLLLAICLLFFVPKNVEAIYNPLSVPNNKYGIHITDLNDIASASELVNSTNGDWGYVTLVVQDTDMNKGKWQELFNIMRRKHLIPLIRIATHAEGDAWMIPEEHNISKWVDFLNSLNWPVENRYVILFNEPNHANEWGNTINPQSYGDILIKFSKALKNASPDFFILPAGLDASASNTGGTMDETVYLSKLFEAHPDITSYIDGWTSHAYPNPAFSGSPLDSGKGTLSTFLWEQSFLKSLGVAKELPVFITETGWEHRYGKYVDARLLTPETIASYITLASNGVWNNPNIVAITPFLLNYQDNPFDHFSWRKLDSQDYYPHYYSYLALQKTQGQPKQREQFTFLSSLLPDTLVINSTYMLETEIKNTGQSIIDPKDGYILTIRDETNTFDGFTETLPVVEPDGQGIVKAYIKTPKTEGDYTLTVMVTHGDTRIPVESKTIHIIPPPSANLSVTLGWRKNSNNQTATVLLYDEKDTLLHKFTDVPIQNNHLIITGLYQVTPGQLYRVVVLVPYYLPRQAIVTMQKKNNTWLVERLYPFDFNRDGKLSIEDIPALLYLKPMDVFTLFLHA